MIQELKQKRAKLIERLNTATANYDKALQNQQKLVAGIPTSIIKNAEKPVKVIEGLRPYYRTLTEDEKKSFITDCYEMRLQNASEAVSNKSRAVKELEKKLNAVNAKIEKFDSIYNRVPKELKDYCETLINNAVSTNADADIESIENHMYDQLVTFITKVENKIHEIKSVDFVLKMDGGLQGVINGINDSVEVYSIEAGGYNVQRLHVRFLTRVFKKD